MESKLSIKASLDLANIVLGELEHPNKMPFSGIMTFFDVPSDYPPGGSGGLKVLIPSDVGIPALDSLVGMAVNFIEGTMDGHAPTEKIGVITGYDVGERLENGAVPVLINGYIYSLDFPNAAVAIKSGQQYLGFSYETANTLLNEGIFKGETVAFVQELGYFTGAAILLRESASYSSTQIVAAKDIKEEEIQVEEMQKLFDELKSYIDQKFADFAKQDAEQDKETAEEVEGQEEAVEEKEAESENVEAAEEEKVESPAEEPAEDVKDEEKEEVKAESEEEVKDEEDKKEGLSAGADLLSVIESLRSEVASLKAEKEERAKHEKKSVSYPMTLMAKHDIQPQDDYKSVIASIDAREGLSVEDRIALKLEAKAQFGNK